MSDVPKQASDFDCIQALSRFKIDRIGLTIMSKFALVVNRHMSIMRSMFSCYEKSSSSGTVRKVGRFLCALFDGWDKSNESDIGFGVAWYVLCMFQTNTY